MKDKCMPALFLHVLFVSQKGKLKETGNADEMPESKLTWHFLSKPLFSETGALNFTFWGKFLMLIFNIEINDS